jgi:hypothetical protein
MLAIHPNARTTPAVRAEIARSRERSGVLVRQWLGSADASRGMPEFAGLRRERGSEALSSLQSRASRLGGEQCPMTEAL